MNQLGSFAAAARRRRGPMGVAARIFVGVLLLMALAGVAAMIAFVVNAFRL